MYFSHHEGTNLSQICTTIYSLVFVKTLILDSIDVESVYKVPELQQLYMDLLKDHVFVSRDEVQDCNRVGSAKSSNLIE